MSTAQHVYAENVLGMKRISVDLSAAPVTLVAGHNASGKSSLAESIRIAYGLGGDRTARKNRLGEALTRGASSGLAQVKTDAGSVSVRLPSGKRDGSIGFDGDLAPYALGSASAAKASARDVLKLAELLSGPSQGDSTAKVREALIAAGHPASKIDEVLLMLRTGVDAVVDEAKSLARDAKTRWKDTTGETFGVAKAREWRPEHPEEAIEADCLEDAESLLAEKRQAVDLAESRLHNARQDFAAATGRRIDPEELERLKSTAKQYAKRAEACNAARRERDAAEKALEDLQGAASGEGLPCPCCGELLVLVDGALQPVGDGDLASPSAIEKAKQRLDSARAELKTAELKFSQASAAADRVDGYDAAEIEREVLSAEAELEQRLQAHGRAAQDCQSSELAVDYYRRIETAAKHARDVSEYLAIAEQVTPDWVAEVCGEDPTQAFSLSLSEASKALGFQRAVTCSSDGVLRYGETASFYCSESEQWRINAAVGWVCAAPSSCGLLLLDRFDLLDLKSRGRLLTGLAKSDGSFAIMLCGTLKARPALPETISVYWVEDGVAVSEQQQEAA